MRAILKEDLIIKLSLKDGVEIGNIPQGGSLDRLRWDGSQIVDLAVLTTIHVRYLGNFYFELHCLSLPNTQAVVMKYKQRKDLRFDEITRQIYLASEQDKEDEINAEEIKALKHKLRMAFGGDNDLFLKHFALTAALIVYASEQPAALKTFFDELTPHIKDAFPLNRWEVILKSFASDIKTYLENIYEVMDR
ncbi:MAG: hypothetical protein KAQ85_07615 [Thermodesulfovibrionia bacterium]|nr:hypothetical protein [Thermodesulfovibrionia bacterium]